MESGFDELLRAADAELPSDPIDEDDPAVILYTSGTTGRPKGALASQRCIIGFVQTTRDRVPTGVQQSVEFRTACPASAVVMRTDLNGKRGTLDA